jgi:hypothetical protein
VIQFSSSSGQNDLARFATQRFVQELTEAQPGVRVLDLGTVDDVLVSVGKRRLDPEAIRALGASANVQAIFSGTLEVTTPRTSVSFSPLALGAGFRQDVTSTLTATLYDASQGATVWTRSGSNHDTASGASIGGGTVSVNAGGEENAYARMVRRSAFAITDAFRSHWVTQRVD